mgnify:CR=1 FL=1
MPVSLRGDCSGQGEQFDRRALLPLDRLVVDGAEAVVEFIPGGFLFGQLESSL